MWRNKEFRMFICFLLFIGILFSVAAFQLSLASCALVTMVWMILGIMMIVYTRYRYVQIQSLSSYLMQVYQGGSILDIRKNQEGELSMLKNDIYKVTLTLKEQSERLQKDKVFLADTLSNISHQLKTPLTSMMVMNDILQDASIPAQKKELFLHHMRIQLERMQHLVESLLKLSKIDAKAIVFKEDRLMLPDLLKEVLIPFEVAMEVKEIQCHINCPNTLMLNGDREWLIEAFSNIVKNAVEHMEEHGLLQIICTVNPLHIEIRIQDDGCGIEQEDIGHIFERFYKGKNASADSVGIGLALAKSIIMNQHGTIYAESEPGVGTLFIIKFIKSTI